MSTSHTLDINSFFIIGLNYKKTDAGIRGLFAVNTAQYDELFSLAPQYNINDFFVVSTCNRTEIYGFAESADQLTEMLCSVCAGDKETFASISYAKSGCDAIAHLYHVAAGLDSQILGDYEILGQIRKAVKYAKGKGFIGTFSERLINSVLQASKAIKTHTELSGGTVSVSFAAVQYIRENISGIRNKKIVLVGTGKIGRVTCRNMIDYLNTHNITLVNRTEETAFELAAELGLHAAPFTSLKSELQSADIVLLSTNAPHAVIIKEHLENSGDKLVIDMSIPCNVAVDAQMLAGITFVDVDMLSKIKDETLQKRRDEVPKALAIIEEHIAEFKEWCHMRRNVPVLKEVKNKLKAIQIEPALLNVHDLGFLIPSADQEEKIQKVINTLATKMRRNNKAGCNYIEAINDFIG